MMARLQILQLPEGASDDRPPFALVIDQVEDAAALGLETTVNDVHGRAVANAMFASLADQLGARTVLVFEGETIEIPANEIPGVPLLRADTGIDSNVQAGLRYIGARYSDPTTAEQRIELARQALAADGYFTPDEIGDDIAPRITEWLAQHRDEAKGHKDRLEAVGRIHKRVVHRGKTICGHCSAWDGPEYDSTDNAPIGWPCDTIKAATGYTGEPQEEGDG